MAPFNYNENKKPKGLSIDTILLVAKKVGLEVEFVTGPTWNEFINMIKSGEIDVMLNIVPTDERKTACVSSQIGCSLTCKFCARQIAILS
jgi:adenine C2-methylase RlmN of 23S rRNA A2503 and tRNA A37